MSKIPAAVTYSRLAELNITSPLSRLNNHAHGCYCLSQNFPFFILRPFYSFSLLNPPMVTPAVKKYPENIPFDPN